MTDISDVRQEPHGLLTFELQSEHIDKISAALSKAQADMTNAIYNRENPHFQSKYADLASVRKASIQHLNANGISLHQASVPDGHGNAYLVTQLTLGDQWLRDYQPLPILLDNPQKVQSFRTYARRSGWASICGIAVAGEDDDGNLASSLARPITRAQLDELVDTARDYAVNMKEFLQKASKHLGYEITDLAQVTQGDKGKVKTWLMSKRKEEVK